MPSNKNDNKKLEEIRQFVESAHLSLQQAHELLDELTGNTSSEGALAKARATGAILDSGDGSNVIEGVYDGQNMIGPDGKQYSIPANYASKSKLLEGDLLKLTIDPTGSFIYKQIGPVERKRLRGKLIEDKETGDFKVLADGKSYKTLLASITYFKGEEGDDVVILVPRDKPSTWAAIENVIKAGSESTFPGDEIVDESELKQEESLESKQDSEDQNETELDSEAQESEPGPTLDSTKSADTTAPSKQAPESKSPPIQFDEDKDEFEEI